MASAEHLLNEAHYAFANISYGESRANKRNAARAESLCRKIIRRYPTSTEASEARAILRRLGESLDVSSMRSPGQAKTRVENHSGRDQAVVGSRAAQTGHTTEVDWSGLIAVLLATPKVVLVVLGAVVFALFALLGPFIFLALVALVVFTGPFRSMLGAPQRQQVEDFIVRANEFIAERRRSGTGLS